LLLPAGVSVGADGGAESVVGEGLLALPAVAVVCDGGIGVRSAEGSGELLGDGEGGGGLAAFF
jgi:hypothetical protein